MLPLIWLTASASPCAHGTEAEAYAAHIDLVEGVQHEEWTVQLDATACPDGPTLVEGESSTPREGTWVIARDTALPEHTSATIDSRGAPAKHSVIRFTTSEKTPLQVFARQDAHQHAGEDSATFWWPKGADGPPLLVWTSWASWAESGNQLATPVTEAVPASSDLGSLGRSLRGAPLEALVSRVDATLDVLPPVTPGWEAPSTPISEVLERGAGTPSERGRVLLAMLSEAGIRARPAWFIGEDDPILPRTLPAPHVLPHPAIAVRTKKGTVYIDPGARGARPPEVPARIRGGRLLEAGRHVVVVQDTASPRGEVRIHATSTVDSTGRIKVYARLEAFGAAEQFLRGALDGTDAPAWPEIVGQWITPRGMLRDLVVGVEGLDGLSAFAIEIRFTEPDRLAGFGPALKGSLWEIIAPGLAQRLPSGIAIAERVDVVPPEGMFVLTAVRPPSSREHGVLLNRAMHTHDQSLTLSSDWRVTAGTASQTVDALAAPSDVLLFPQGDRKGRRAARRLDLSEQDTPIVEGLLLWRIGEEKKARKQLDRLHPDRAVPDLVEQLATYAPPGDRRPWEALVQLVHNDAERIAVIAGLDTIGDQRLGWQLATALTRSPDPETQIRALIEVARLQGPKPDARSDPEGNRAWRDPLKLLEAAQKRAGRSPVAKVVHLPLALAYLRGGRPMDASELLDRAMDSPTPLAHAAYAEFGGITGVYGIDVLGHAETARTAAPYDPNVREAAGRALAAIGRRRQGVAEVLLAAELAGKDMARWMRAAEVASTYGDLRAAVFASRRASDLAPEQLLPAIQLQRFASLAQDSEQLRVATERTGESLFINLQGDLDALLEAAPDDELALLRHHVDEVEGDRSLLRRRAAAHFERGMIEDAALDGSLLLDRHRDQTGRPLLAAGILGRTRHSNPARLLAGNSGREARMDIQIVTGARRRPTGARGRLVTQTLRKPQAIATAAPTWPLGLNDFEHNAPPGFEEDPLLGAVKGVAAWSDPLRQMAILRTERSTGDLPPPIAVLFQNGPTVLSTDRGASVVRLDGGAIPVYAGITIHQGQDVIGLGLSPQAARDAVLYGIAELEPPPAPAPDPEP